MSGGNPRWIEHPAPTTTGTPPPPPQKMTPATVDTHPSTNRRRGRPAGKKTDDLSREHLGIVHFAFLRAWINGIDLQKAWRQYLGYQDERSDERHIKAVRDRLYDRVLSDGKALFPQEPNNPLEKHLQVLASRPRPKKLFKLPSIEEFCAAEGIDPDFYSQAELLQLMKEHFHLDQPVEEEHDEPERHTTSQHVLALNALQTYLAKPVGPNDSLALWLSKTMATRISAEAGVITVADLVAHINVYGRSWHRRIKGFGPTRAKRIEAWLEQHEESTGLKLRPTEARKSPPPPSIQTQVKSYGIVPVERLLAPPHLSGATGILRSTRPNTLGANNDEQAWQIWLRSYEGRPRTHEAYKREIERFWLWCMVHVRKPLSSINAEDCASYKIFLEDPPPEWIMGTQARRTSCEWRPFRRKLDVTSIHTALSIVNAMYSSLLTAGYLVGNPMATIAKQSRSKQQSAGDRRGFSEEQWQWIKQEARRRSDGPRKSRLILLLDLLVETGLRLDEITNARRSDIELVDVDGEKWKAWVIHVVGKGGKKRVIPISDETVARIDAHLNDETSARWGNTSKMPTSSELPLILPIAAPIQARPGQSTPSPHPNPSLSRAGIYKILKRFFTSAAMIAKDQKREDAVRIGKASTHWLRHTFGRQALANDVPLDVAKEILGHESLNTTALYATTERSRLIKETRKSNALAAKRRLQEDTPN